MYLNNIYHAAGMAFGAGVIGLMLGMMMSVTGLR